jgi:hypothetical protein
MLTTSSLVASATAVRVGVACVELLAGRTRPLVGRAVAATMGGTDKGRAQAEFRDDFLALARDSTEVTWREMRRGVDDLDALTRPREQPGARPHRPYRYKF